MDQFDGAGGGIERDKVGAEQIAGGVDQQWTHALAAEQRGVAHGGLQSRIGKAVVEQ